MDVFLIEPELRDEWLRMRMQLWPECSLEEHRSEIYEYFTGGSDMASFVAVRTDGRLGGFLEASIRPLADGCETRPVGYIEGWYVAPDLRRQGVGRKLVDAAESSRGHPSPEAESTGYPESLVYDRVPIAPR